eukprot:TRINITY_DN8722_c0_g1_i4.p1 TRINITY_DN8722_c0_g1~~TRINITY_DN8722_c0_g1_i4.p1  ORF type:complete len:183 (-),score=16.67 TRINITY_DN8722_c0_g1_i4:197-745(-)
MNAPAGKATSSETPYLELLLGSAREENRLFLNTRSIWSALSQGKECSGRNHCSKHQKPILNWILALKLRYLHLHLRFTSREDIAENHEEEENVTQEETTMIPDLWKTTLGGYGRRGASRRCKSITSANGLVEFAMNTPGAAESRTEQVPKSSRACSHESMVRMHRLSDPLYLYILGATSRDA